jgi:hypothetical protein
MPLYFQDRHVKRQTLSWNDFSTAGFLRTDDPLSAGVLAASGKR